MTKRHINTIRLRSIENMLKRHIFKSFDVITWNADKQFVTQKFQQYVANISIEIKTIFVETHHSIKMIKRYHESLRGIYSIFFAEISEIDFESVLKMSLKVLNNSIKLNNFVSTFLIFETYSKLIEKNISTFTIIQRAISLREMNQVSYIFMIYL